MSGLDRGVVLGICLVACVLNVAFVGTLAGTGVLKTAEPDDVRFTNSVETPDGTVKLPADGPDRFVVETPTDVDVFYNTVVYYRHAGELYPIVDPPPTWDPAAQLKFNYAPVVVLVFIPLYYLGYFGFKVAWLLASLVSVVIGTYLLIDAEDIPLPERERVFVALAAIGFQPMVANFKTGQVTPVVFLLVAMFWWLYRQKRPLLGGGVLVGAAVFKPYFVAPLAVAAKRHDFRGLLGFAAVFGVVTALTVIGFGMDTLVTYYRILWSFVIDEGGSTLYAGVDSWSATHLRPLYWLGGYAPLVRLLFVIPVAAAAIAHFLDRIDRPVGLFSLSIVSLMVSLATTTTIDAAMLLAVFVVFGYRLYHVDGRAFTVLALAFLLMHVHAYVLEALVGWGPENFRVLAAVAEPVIGFLPLLQPGVYAVFILFGLSMWAVAPPRITGLSESASERLW